jgi:hypothetical protein
MFQIVSADAATDSPQTNTRQYNSLIEFFKLIPLSFRVPAWAGYAPPWRFCGIKTGRGNVATISGAPLRVKLLY